MYNTRKKERQIRNRNIGSDILIKLLDFKVYNDKEVIEKNGVGVFDDIQA